MSRYRSSSPPSDTPSPRVSDERVYVGLADHDLIGLAGSQGGDVASATSLPASIAYAWLPAEHASVGVAAHRRGLRRPGRRQGRGCAAV